MNCVNTFFSLSFYKSTLTRAINHRKYSNYFKQYNKYLSINSNFICCPRTTIFIVILIFYCFEKELILCLALLFEHFFCVHATLMINQGMLGWGGLGINKNIHGGPNSEGLRL